MAEVDGDVPMPRQLLANLKTKRKRNDALELAKSLYANGGVGKSTAAKLALKEIGLWSVVEYQSAIDYLRRNI